MTAKSTDLSLDINEEEYIDRVETKIESPKAEVITPNSDKIFSLSMDNDEGSSVDSPSENGTRACDDNEFKDESWIDHCETKIIADDHLKCLKEILISSVARTITNDKIGDEIQDIYDSKKNKSRGSYEITSATSFFLFNTKNSKKTAEKTGVNNSPVKVKETQVSMLYQMGVEAIGKPLEPKSHEEYPLQLADDSSSVQNAALAAEDSRSASAKAGWASIRQESGELENYLLEEDDDENVIIHLGTEFAQDAMEGGKNEDMTTVDYKDQYEGTRKTDSSSKTVLSPGGKKCDKNNLAEEKEEDTSVYDSEENKTCTSDKLSQLENVLSNMSQEDSLQMVKQEQGASSVEKHTYKTQVSAESKHLNMKNSDIENIATEGKTFQAKDDRIHTAQFGKSVQKYPSQVLSKDGQTNIGEISESQSQEHLTDEKITRQQTEQLNLSQSIAINAQGNSKQYDAKESNKKDSIPQMKQIEVERKFRISTDCRQKLMDMGAVMAKENKFSDKYFDDIRYKMTLSDSWLRQRNGRWEFKIPPRHMSKKDPSSQLLEITSETEIMKHLCKLYNCCGSVDDRTLDQLMNKLCLDSFATFTTIRQTYFLPNCTVQLDIADFGFEVGEIEVVVSDESRITDALNIIDDVAKKLGVTSKDRFP